MWGVKLEFDGSGTLGVVDEGERLASVDTRTLRVTTPKPSASTAAARPRHTGGDGPGGVAAPTALLVAGSTLVLARRRRRSAIRTAAP